MNAEVKPATGAHALPADSSLGVPPAGWNRFLAENYRRNLYFCTLMTSTTKFDRYGIRERVELCN